MTENREVGIGLSQELAQIALDLARLALEAELSGDPGEVGLDRQLVGLGLWVQSATLLLRRILEHPARLR